jgi:ATP-dependent helicase/nuclease subunit A
MAPQWTDAQKRAITTRGRSLLVSAAAGSGKTAVLAERCAYLACEGKDACDVDELLVVTFTEAAAAEMRKRIQDSVIERVRNAVRPDKRLLRQAALVEHAHVSTIHGFCSQLLHENFSLAGIDPHFSMMDGDEARQLRRQVARELFDDCYEREGSDPFRAFIDAYGDGNDDALLEQVQRAHEMLCSLAQPEAWMRKSMDRLTEAGRKPLKDSELGQNLLHEIEAMLTRLQRQCSTAESAIKALRDFGKLADVLAQRSQTVAGWQKTLKQSGYDALVKEYRAFDPPPAPSIKTGTPKKEEARGIYETIKKEMQDGELNELLTFTEARWRDGQEKIAPMAQVFFSLIKEFGQRYTRAKRQLQALDFADLERMALKLLGNPREGKLVPSDLALQLHRRWKHVLVDEYQDVNEIQDEILALISTERVEPDADFEPNLFTVGDVKQSIYNFRLAEPERFLQRAERFRDAHQTGGEVIDLQENFRSRPFLLDAVNQVFRRLMTKAAADIEYDQTQELRPPPGKTDPPGGPAPIELHLIDETPRDDDDDDLDIPDRIEQEAMLCAELIKNLKDGGTELRDIAILLRSLARKADNFARILRNSGIPIHSDGGTGFFAATEVRDMLAALSAIDNQQQDIPLAAYLRGPLAGVSETDLAQIRVAYPEREVPFHLAVAQYSAEKSDETAARLKPALARLAHWRDLARQRPLAELIWSMYDQSHYLVYVAGLPDGGQRVANLLHLHERARQFGSFLSQGLNRFMAFISELRDEDDLGLPSIPNQSEQCVRLMSIHKSKGLEFPIVIVPDLGKRHNLSQAKGTILLDRRTGAGLSVVDVPQWIRYASLSSTLTSQSLRRQGLAEELRVLYVAMTRAKQRLLLVGSCSEAKRRQWAREWTGKPGPMEPGEFLSAQSMLDWIGPVQAACGDRVMPLILHAADNALPARKRPTPPPQELKSMQPLKPKSLSPGTPGEGRGEGSPPPPPPTQITQTIARLEFIYPHQQETNREAARAATAQKNAASEPSPLPEYRRDTAPMTAAEVGTATHLFLEHFDFSRGSDVEAQIADLTQRQLLRPDQAAVVDRAAIAWLMTTDLGKLLAANATALLREIPFAMADASQTADPMDAVMVRGRLDLLVPLGSEVAIVDYKTDHITRDEVPERAANYMGQMDVYRDALHRVAAKSVATVHLVFLHPRVVFSDRGPAPRAGP